jgi:hypothetical protein
VSEWSDCPGEVWRDEYGTLHWLWALELRADACAVRCKVCGQEEDLPDFWNTASHEVPTHLELWGIPGSWVRVECGQPPWDEALWAFRDRHKKCQTTIPQEVST